MQRRAQFGGNRFAQIDRARIAHRHRKALLNIDRRAQPVRLGNPGGQLAQRRVQRGAVVRRQRAQRAAQGGAIGDDIVRGAGMDFRHGDHHRVRHRKAAGDQRLDRAGHFAGDRHRIERLMRHRGMAAAPGDHDFKPVGRGKQRTGTAGDDAVRAVGHDMQRKGGVGRGIEQPVVDHEARAVKPFLAGLKHEQHIAGQLIGARAQHMRGARQHRRMGIMPARMHRACNLAGKVQPGFLVHRQRIGIAAQQHGAARAVGGCSAGQPRGQPGGRGAVAPLQRQMRQRRAQLVARRRVVQPQFGFGMDRAAQADDLIGKAAGGFEQGGMQHGVDLR